LAAKLLLAAVCRTGARPAWLVLRCCCPGSLGEPLVGKVAETPPLFPSCWFCKVARGVLWGKAVEKAPVRDKLVVKSYLL